MPLPARKVFLDTNIIMDNPTVYEDYELCLLSITTLEEIDKLKQSMNEEIAYKAREVSRQLLQADNVKIILDYSDIRLDLHINDNKIIACAKQEFDKDNELVLLTNDVNMYFKAKALEIPVELYNDNSQDEIYQGFKEVTLGDYELATFYECMINQWDLLENQYLIIKDSNGSVVDKLKWTSKGFSPITKKPFDSIYFGKTKPRDVYQELAIDSLANTEFTILMGAAGSAKTLLSLSYIMQNIQTGKFDKCVIAFAPTPLKGNKTLGFYPGTRNEKILSSSLGGILSSKLGDISLVETLVAQGKLLLVPTAEIRGLEINKKDCLYVTEAQNTDRYTMKTVIQRAEEGCKIILEGDVEEQTDSNHFSGNRNGLLRAINVFKGTKHFSCVKLQNIYRSPIADIAQQM